MLADRAHLRVWSEQKVESFPMIPKIVGRHIQPLRSLPANDLRHVFETAVAELHEADLATRKRLQYRAPIVQRGSIFGASQVDAEKRALTDAARALALLWKV